MWRAQLSGCLALRMPAAKGQQVVTGAAVHADRGDMHSWLAALH